MHDTDALTLTRAIRDDYEILGEIGSGAMSVVLKARHRRLHRNVAIKFLTRDDEESRLRFEREARALAGLKHPRIVGCLDAVLEGEHPFVVMELLEGNTLHESICAGPVELKTALTMAHQAAQGLAYLHANQVVHRDVKPANLLLAADGSVKVSDFGLARFNRSGFTITEQGHAVGTPEYISPEVVTAQPATPASDVYAMGVVLFELLTGVNPFRRAELRAVLLAQVEVPAPDLTVYCPTAPREVADLVRRMLSKNPAERPADGAALVEALEGAGAPVSGRVAVPSRDRARVAPAATQVMTPADAVVQAFSEAILAPLRQRRIRFAMASILAFALLVDGGLWLYRHRGDLALQAASVVETAALGSAVAAHKGNLLKLGEAAAARVAGAPHRAEADRMLATVAQPIRIAPAGLHRKGITPLVRAESDSLSDLLMVRDLVDDLKRSYLSTSTSVFFPSNPLTIEVGLTEPPGGAVDLEIDLRAPAPDGLVAYVAANGARYVRMMNTPGRRGLFAKGLRARRGSNLFTVTFVRQKAPATEVLLDAVHVRVASPGWAAPAAGPMEPLLQERERSLARRIETALAAADWRGALTLAEELNQRAPLYGPAWMARGVAIVELNPRASRADLDALDEAVRLMPSSAAAWCALGRAYLRHGNLEEARRAHIFALGLEPTRAEVYAELAAVERMLGHGEAAVRHAALARSSER